MAKSPKSDAADTELAKLERHVDEMLDPARPEKVSPASANKIAVQETVEVPEQEVPTAPPVTGKRVPKEPIAITVREHSATDETPTAPLPAVVAKPSEERPAPVVVPDADQPATPDEGLLPDAYDDPQTSTAVDEVVAEESDELLAMEDELSGALEVARPSLGERVRGLFGNWWRNPATRWGTVLVVLGLLGAGGAWPTTRYAALNGVGIRSSASVRIIDQSSLQPLKDVRVKIADRTGQTDSNGIVRLNGLKLGPSLLTIEKKAFAPINRQVTVGWGSNPLGGFDLQPVGSQYAIVVTDYVSGKPVAKVAASVGEADAQSDERGIIKLTIEHNGKPLGEVMITAPGYRQERVTLDAASKQQIALKLVPVRKEIFVSKRSGKYDVYTVDIDGKNEQVVLAGTGSERDDMVLLPHPNEEVAAVVSTRDNKRNQDGYLLSTLTLINMREATSWTAAQSEQITLANWAENRLVYVQTIASASAANPNRQRLMSYDYTARDSKQLAATNYFNDVLVAGGKVYYAPSATYQGSGGISSLYRINPDGTTKQTILSQEAWNMYRTAPDKLTISSSTQWYEYPFSAAVPRKLDGAPANIISRVYVDTPDGKRSLWVDNRDGKGTLLLYTAGTGADKVLKSQSGLTNPVRWLNDHTVIYRIKTDQETADYALSLDGGEALKLKDVTATGNVNSWYYY